MTLPNASRSSGVRSLSLLAFCCAAMFITSCTHAAAPAPQHTAAAAEAPAKVPGTVIPGVPELLAEPFRMPEEFPLPDDAARVSPDPQARDIVFHTSKSLDEILQFYRGSLSAVGLTEHPSSTKRNQFGFRAAFLGWPGLKAILIQATDATRFNQTGSLPRIVSARLVEVEVRDTSSRKPIANQTPPPAQ